MTDSSDKTTHFGYQSVGWDEKQQKVADVFHRVASRYDLMNDLMSLGVHRIWKSLTVELARVKPSANILDLAAGSGDMARRLYPKIKNSGHITLADINASMLQVGRNRLADEGIIAHVDYVQANAECLPFAPNSFDLIIMAFGLRNVTDKAKALKSMFHVCKPGGKLMVLEFSKPKETPLKTIYDWYSFRLLPKLGGWVANDEESYQYLAESIRMHPDQETLKKMMLEAGFDECHYRNLTHGIVTIHTAYKY